MAKSAHVITVGLSSFLNTSIRAWFDQFNFMPPIPLAAERIDTITGGEASLTRLLSTMAASPHKNFILIIHGHSDGSGLALRLAPEQAKPHTSYFDLARLMDIAGSGRELDRADQAKMGVGRRGSHQILDLMHKVKAKQIECLEFRACNLGRNASSLDRFRRFFGAKLAGAPDLHSFFGSGPVSTDPRQLHTHTKSHDGNWETYSFPSVFHQQPNLVCCFSLDGDSKPTGGHIVADSPSTLNAWVKKYVMPTGSPPTGNMALHGLWVSDIKVAPKKPGEKPRSVPAAIVMEREHVNQPLGGWSTSAQRFIPPLSENYAKHIVYAK
jgi:hypothetical protein